MPVPREQGPERTVRRAAWAPAGRRHTPASALWEQPPQSTSPQRANGQRCTRGYPRIAGSDRRRPLSPYRSNQRTHRCAKGRAPQPTSTPMSRLSRPGACAGANARDSSAGLVAGGQHDENRSAQPVKAGSRMGATKDDEMANAATLNRADLINLANDFVAVRNNEATVTTVMRLWIAFGRLEYALQVSPVSRYRFEFPVNGGRIDLLLFHADSGITIVEAKGEVSASLIAAGIGQLCLYKALLGPVIAPLKPAYVNLILAAPIAPEDSGAMSMACEMAGVRLVPMPVFGEVNEQADLLRKKYGAQVFSDAGAVG